MIDKETKKENELKTNVVKSNKQEDLKEEVNSVDYMNIISVWSDGRTKTKTKWVKTFKLMLDFIFIVFCLIATVLFYEYGSYGWLFVGFAIIRLFMRR